MQKHRFEELEGLRGVAAIIVVIYHFILAFYAVLFFGIGAQRLQHMRFEDNLYGNPLMVFVSGPFAVAIFFVLSGFVLSIAFFQTGKLSIVKKLAAKRYLRLMLPALASILIACFILMAGVSFLKENVAAISGSGWLERSWSVVPNVFEAAQSGMFDIFMKEGNSYNNVLWTMVFEFAGSFLVFGFLALFGKLKYRWVVYGFLGFATFNTWFFAFIIGMLMADLYANGYLKPKRHSWFLIAPVLILSLVFGGYPAESVKGTIYQYMTIGGLGIDWTVVYLTFGAIGLVGVILLTEQIAAVFRRRAISKLGKYTFALYLIHLPVIYTFGMAIFLIFYKAAGLGFNVSVLLTLIASAPIIAGAAILFEKYVDAPSIKFSTYISNILLGYESPENLKKRWRRVYRRLIRPFRPARGIKNPELVVEEVIE